MRDAIADIVHSIFRQALSLRDRLEAGEALQPATMQAALGELLAPLATEEIWDVEEDEGFYFDFSEADIGDDPGRLSQATVRYALTCWIDELFLCYSPCGESWRKQTLEAGLYGTSRRPGQFWEEAHYAEIRADVDALEVLYWCVMLGYRGAWRDHPERVESWAKRIVALLEPPTVTREAVSFDGPPPLPAAVPTTDLPYRRMLFAMILSFSLGLPLAAAVYLRYANI